MSPEMKVLSGLLENLYDAAADPAQWQTFLRRVASEVRGDAAAIMMHDPDSRAGVVNCDWGLDPESTEQYRAHYWLHDPWAAKGLQIKARDITITSEALVPFDQYTKTTYYNEFAKRFDVPHGIFTRIEYSETRSVNLSVYRGHSRGGFDEDDLTLLSSLVPHLRRAFRFHMQLAVHQEYSRSMETALDSIANGIIFLNDNGECLFQNRSAEAILSRNDGLFLRRKRLSAALLHESELLAKLVASAIATSNGTGTSAGGSLAITRPSGSPLAITVSPVGRGVGFAATARPAAVVFITDPNQ